MGIFSKKKYLNLKLEKNYVKFSKKGLNNFVINDLTYFKYATNIIKNTPYKLRRRLKRRFKKKAKIIKTRNFYLQLHFLYFNGFNIMKIINDLKLVNLSLKLFRKYQTFWLVSLDYYQLTDYQLELIRRLIRKRCGKYCFIKLLIEANNIILKRPNQMRMGGGKGIKISKSIYGLKPGSRLLEIRGLRFRITKYICKSLNYKINFRVKLITVNRI